MTLNPLPGEIRSLRLLSGYSQRDLARVAAIRQATVSAIERGGSARPSTILAIARALGVPVDRIAILKAKAEDAA